MANLIGGNGQGFFQNYDPQTKTWLQECFGTRPFVVNFPGGAESNIATTAPLIKGWGLTEEIINQRFGAGQIDENGEGLDKWLGKLSQQNLEATSYIYELQALKQDFPAMEIVWKANIVSGSLDAAKLAFESVYAVCPFTKCVMGNEIYSKGNFNFDFGAFLVKAEPFMTWIRQSYPNVKIGIPFAPNLGRADHLLWDNALIEYARTSGNVDAVDVHIYLGADELVDAYASYPAEKYNFDPNAEYPNLETCFDTFCEEYRVNSAWEDTISFIEQNFPGKAVWMTEFNTNPSSNFCNSVANAAFLFSRFMEFNHRVEVMCVHNLVAPDTYGCICRTDAVDIDQTTVNTRRTGYYALKLASEALQYHVRQQMGMYQEAAENTCYYYDNTVGDVSGAVVKPFTPVSGSGGKEFASVVDTCLYGDHTYDALGKIGYVDKKAPAYTPDVQYVRLTDNFTEVNPETFPSFGYIYVEVKDVAPPPPPPVKPCKKRWWEIWKKPCGKAIATNDKTHL